MTESEPAYRERISAGEIGVHRTPMGRPLINPGFSRNIAPQRLDGPQIIEYSDGSESVDQPDITGLRPIAAELPTTPARRPEAAPQSPTTPAPRETAPAERERHAEPPAPRRRNRPMMLLAAGAALLLVLRRLLRRATVRRPPVMRRLPIDPSRRRRARRRR